MRFLEGLAHPGNSFLNILNQKKILSEEEGVKLKTFENHSTTVVQMHHPHISSLLNV
jgi:hypothetical protein